MAIMPEKISERLEWGEVHAPVFTSNAPQIGLSEPQSDDFATAVTAFRAKYDAALAARSASQAATTEMRAAMQTFLEEASECLATIKAFAENSEDPMNVYAKAEIPPPAQPSPLGPPATPTNVSGQINNIGNVELKWTASKQGGVFFSIWRKLYGTPDWVLQATVGEKKWTDETIAAGTILAQYYVVAHRGPYESEPSEPIVVVFGQQQAA